MTFDLDPQLPEEQTYEEPKRFVHELREDGSEPGVVGHMNPKETEVFIRMRKEQTNEDEGGIGVTRQRAGSMPLLLETVAAAKAEVARG